MSLNIYEAYEGKSIFFTGVTGFVGKVFLYKLLKEFPRMRKVFVLIRTKKGQAPLDRFKKEVLSSECFTPLKKSLGEEEYQRRMSLVVPMSGDMLEDKLGLCDNDYQTLVDEVDYIIHIAATVNFQEMLKISVKMNVLGALRVLALAQKCKHLESMVHTSTCYVNWNRASGEVPVKEQIYPLPFDPEDMVKLILALHDQHIPAESKNLLEMYRFPNTYTFTKSIAEQLLYKYKGKLPLSIVRPAIIGCSWKEPTPGWIDVLTAAGAIILTAALGILHELHADENYIADLIPVDFVCNTLIKTSYKTALHHKIQRHVDSVNRPLGGEGNTLQRQQAQVTTHSNSNINNNNSSSSNANPNSLMMVVGKEGKTTGLSTDHVVSAAAAAHTQGAATAGTLTVPSASTVNNNNNNYMQNNVAGSETDHGDNFPFIFQSCSSGTKNKMRWRMVVGPVLNLWSKDIPHPRSIGKIDCVMVRHRTEYLFRLYVYRKLPFYAMKTLANMPKPIGSSGKKAMLAKYEKALKRTEMLNSQFRPFTTRQWMYESENSKVLDEGLDAASASAFATDVYDIQWWTYCELYSWGMTKFIMKSANREQPQLPESASAVFMKAKM